MKKAIQKLTALLLASASFLVASPAQASSLADRNYQGKKVITVNRNRPTFSKKILSTKKGTWQSYHKLDSLNRAGEAYFLNFCKGLCNIGIRKRQER